MSTALAPALMSFDVPAANGYPKIKVTASGRRSNFLYIRPDGTWGVRRARSDEEKERASLFQKIRCIVHDQGFWETAGCLPGNMDPIIRKRGRKTDHPAWMMLLLVAAATQTGSQTGAVTLLADPLMWDFIRELANRFRPAEWREAGPLPPTRNHLSTFNKKWKSQRWDTIVGDARDTAKDYALREAFALGYFDPGQPLEYANVDFRQWVTLDGTVYQPPSSRTHDDGGRTDTGSGWHSKGGEDCAAYGSKFSIIETISDEYLGALILDYDHVTPKPGKQQGDEAATSEAMLHELKDRAPGLRGNTSDSALRGGHNARLLNHDVITINHPVAEKNPNRKTEGRFGEGRVERTHKIRTVEHARTNGQPCIHTIYLVGSVPHQESIDGEGNVILQPLIATGYKSAKNDDGTCRWYQEINVECRHGDFDAYIRFDAPGRNDVKNLSRADLARFYPTNSPQFGYIYGRRNSSESMHSKMKRTMPVLPAYGARLQSLYMLGYMIANNAISMAFGKKRRGEPNALDGTG